MPELIQSLLKLPPYLLALYVIGIAFVTIFAILLFVPRKNKI